MAEQKITEASVLELVGKHEITASKGAELLSLSLWDFMDLMHEHGLTMCDETPEEIDEDLADLERIRKKNVKRAN